MTEPNESAVRVPHESLGRLFLRFLKFGSLAWGGPVAQIAMIQHERVVEEKWVSPQHFNRVLAMYQVLPGPEAHELCVYFGMLARGRIGGILAGLGFMLHDDPVVAVRSLWTTDDRQPYSQSCRRLSQRSSCARSIASEVTCWSMDGCGSLLSLRRRLNSREFTSRSRSLQEARLTCWRSGTRRCLPPP
jgi:hypothetical protein